MQSGSYRLKITGLKYHMYIPSAPPPIFREVWEAHHLVTRLLLWKIIAHQPLSGNLFFQPSQTQKANEPVNPFTVGTCRASGGLQSGFPAEMPLSWKKGCSKCTLLEYPLAVINIFCLLFLAERGKLSAYVGFYSCYAKNTLLLSIPA